jgi:phosphopantothenoylcysteine synthetase/decarboxylase
MKTNKKNKKCHGAVLVTSGPTRAYIDKIRYIANTSSGALGAAIVDTLLDEGYRVIHLHGMGSAVSSHDAGHPLLDMHEIITVADLQRILESIASSDAADITAVVHAMAVLDYVPDEALGEKKASGDDEWLLRLIKTPKVIGTISGLFPHAFRIGFKLETGMSHDELAARALNLICRNSLHLVVANLLEEVKPGGNTASHKALIVDSRGVVTARPETKHEIALELAALIKKQGGAS